jgi:hypothetical protein
VLTVSSRFGKRQASASTNVFDDAGLRRAVETSERLARPAIVRDGSSDVRRHRTARRCYPG